MKFETSKLEQAVEFITAKGLHKVSGSAAQLVRVKATGGGAYKFTEVMQVHAQSCTEQVCIVEALADISTRFQPCTQQP